MANELNEVVEMSGDCFYNILRATREVDYLEPRLDLIGKREVDDERIVFRLINSYPIITVKMKPTEVDYGNMAARQRMYEMDKALVRLGSVYRTIGQCHHHLHSTKTKVVGRPSKEDVDGAEFEMRKFNLRYYFIELIGEVKRLKYLKPEKLSLNIYKKGKGIKILFNHSTYRGTDLCLRGFKIVKRKGTTLVKKELNIDLVRSIIESRESLIERLVA